MKNISGSRDNRIYKDNRGFTLLETLLVVAIIAVLLGISIMGVVAVQKELRQRELDSKAEMIYMAAQNRMTELTAGGRAELYSPADHDDVCPLGLVPCDSEDENRTVDSLYYVKSDQVGSGEPSTAAVLLPESRVEKEIRDNNWVIEYDPASGSVYGVFYSEDDIDYIPGDFDTLRIKQMRKKAGAKVGYYGGDTVVSIDTNTLDPKIEIINEETLKAILSCNMIADGNVSFKVKIEDEYGNSVDREIKSGEIVRKGSNLSFELILDELDVHNSDGTLKKDGNRFCELYPELVAGSDITITLTAVSDNAFVDSAAVTGTANSLFAKAEKDKDAATEDVAIITYGRHLQNLDEESGLNEKTGFKNFKKAVQKNNLHFENDEENMYDWYSTYGSRAYKAVSNSRLESYSGSYSDESEPIRSVIYGLDARTGMFDEFNGSELKDITLSGAKITGGEYAGALAGRITGNVNVSGCQVYLSETEGDLAGKTEKDIWISGSKYTGGLIGKTSGSVKITESFAATVAGTANSDYIGGLAGYAEGTLELKNSYADCYLYGKNAGGLIGSADNNCRISIEDCYSAGYITASDKAAGFVPAKAAAMKNAYSAVAYMKHEDKYAENVYATVSENNSPSKVYYLNADGIDHGKAIGTYVAYKYLSNKAEFINNHLSDAFTASTGGDSTKPYNLMKQGLTDYSFPKLKKLTHYGDWKADFEDNKPVYYEVYENDKYGIYGANIDTLKDKGSATGDGYGIIYENKPLGNVKLEYEYGNETVTLKADKAEKISVGDAYYWLLKFPSEIVNTKKASEDFYQEIKLDGVSYYYNPHFAKTVTSEKSNTVSNVYVRTARQLYNMSLYYNKYAEKTKSSKYTQQLDIYYDKYKWKEYAGIDSVVTEQKPIGKNDTYEFTSTYDGGSHIIDGVSFVSDGYYSGMFGYNKGILQNIAVVSDYGAADDRSVGTSAKIENSGARAYLGVLAGRNSKTIRNCAVAGYTFKVYTYRSSVTYIGGLTGYNSGTVRNSSVDCPEMKISQTYANVSAGGFAGGNTGNISGCYSLGRVDIIESKQGDTTAAGFTGENAGVISNAYCAVSITISGSAKGCGFAPAGGTVKNDCRYLDKGTYYYAEELNAYNIAAGDKRAVPVNSAKLKALVDNKNRAGKSLYHGKTTETDYPYPAAVKKDKEYIHYGNWPVEIELGNTGVFYWEHEEGGPNAGYHFRYLGVNENRGIGGSSLCTAHNDGGIVKEFGYGYYYKEGSNATVSMTDFGGTPIKDDKASAEIKGQLSSYEVVAYTTGNGDGGLYLDKKNGNTPVKVANGTWELKYTENNNEKSYTYTVCPFFANSFSCDTVTESTGYEGNTVVPGSTDNKYEVRSADQLQYINWNCREKNTTTYVKSEHEKYDSFSYLRYAGINGISREERENWNYRYWDQTHDIDRESGLFTPVGSMYYTTDDNKGNAYIAYFGDVYNGNSYSIKNIKIKSDAQMVGLFGITVRAKLENIVMYSEYEDTIEITKDSNKWYCLGGLVGFATEGKLDDGEESSAVLQNCTVSGYSIIDSREHDGGWGGASIGGLAGATNMDISRCTAVNDITVNAKYSDTKWNNVRVGGLVGNCRSTIDGCYAGGSIESRMPTKPGSNVSTSASVWIGGINGGIVMIDYGNLNGIVGTIDEVVNVKNSYSYVKLPATGNNQIRCSQSIASIGEMQDNFASISNPYLKIENCYAYEETAKNTDDYKEKNNEKYWSGIKENDKIGSCIVYSYFAGNGGERYISLDNKGKSPYVTYEQLSAAQGTAGSVADLLNNNGEMPKTVEFGFVTSIENGASIDGKYSFPGDDASLEGVNYPFPTVLTQKNTFGDTVNVHYGTWPKGELYWQHSMNSFDMLEKGEIEMNLVYKGTGDVPALDEAAFKFLDEEGKELAESPLLFKSCQFVPDSQKYQVIFTALKEGTVTVRANLGATTADTLVSITANLVITAAPAELELSKDQKKELSFTVKSVNKSSDFTKHVKWKIEADDDTVVSVDEQEYDDTAKNYKVKITGLKEGEASITAEAEYTVSINGEQRVFKESIVVLANVTGSAGTGETGGK